MKRAINRFVALFATLGMLGAMAGYVTLSATAASAVTSTNVGVGAVDMAPVHNTTAQQEWAFEDTDTQSGTLAFVSGPAGSLGTGSLAMSMADPPGQHEWIVNYSYGPCAAGWSPCNTTPVNLNAFTALSYETYRTSGGQMPTLNIEVSPPGTGSGYTTFVYVPDPSQYANNAWQTWDPFNDSTPRWYSTHNVTSPGGGVFNCSPQTAGCYATWAQIVASYPSAFVLGGIGPNIGTGGNFVGNVDALTIGVNSANTVYDFEPPCSSTCYVATSGRDNATGQVDDPYKTITEGLNAVTAGGTVHVAAGSYNESLTISKAVTLDGANVGVAGTASRGPESVVTWGGGSGSDFNITTADPVTINGFKIQFTGGEQTGGLLISLQSGNQLTFSNNVVNNSSYVNGLIFDDSAASSVIQNNLFDSIAQTSSPGSCVLCTWGNYPLMDTVNITGNTFSNLTDNDGVPAINFTDVSGAVSGNTFTNIHQYGILLANHLGPLSITTNTFTNIHNDTPLTSQNRGSGIRTFQNPTFVGTGVDINHNTFSGDYNGVRVANDGPAATLSNLFKVNRNSFSGDTNEGISVASGTGGTPLAGTCNWWGSGDGPSGAGPGLGDAVSSDVTFLEWLGSSDLDATCGPTVSLGPDRFLVEGNSNHVDYVPVTLSSPRATDTTVHYLTVKGTAASNSDYLKASGTLTIPAGQTQGLIAVTIVGDTTPEPNQYFTMNLSAPSAGVQLGRATSTIWIFNDDIKATMKNSSAIEGGSVPFTFKLTYPMTHPVTVHFCTNASGTASTSDYTFTACSSGSQDVTIQPGNLTATVAVQTNIDHTTETAETFQMQASVSAPDTLSLTATGTIKGNHT